MCDENTLDFVNELQAYMVRVIELEAENERLRQPTQSKVAAAGTDRIGGAGIVTHGVVGVATQSDALREALVDLLHAVCGKTGFAETVRRDSGRIYPWPALDLAEAKALEALERSK